MTSRRRLGEPSQPSGGSRADANRAGARAGSKTKSGLYGSELDSANMVRAATAETIGTFVLVFAGTAVAVAALLDRPIAGGAYGSVAIPLAFGLALVALVSALGHVSGAHFNPAVTISLASTRKFPWSYVPSYLLGQFAGAILGSLATWLTYGAPGRRVELGATYPSSGVSDVRALAVEALITFILVLVIISVATDERVGSTAAASVAVGFALAVGIFIGGPISGGAVNPARALGPMIVAGKLTSFWIYLIGPTVGGVLAAVVYDKFLAQAETPSVENEPGGAEHREGQRPAKTADA